MPHALRHSCSHTLVQVAVGRRERLPVFGNDYDTKDGTGMRDFIHVEDLAAGHLAALRWLQANPRHCDVFNLGTRCRWRTAGAGPPAYNALPLATRSGTGTAYTVLEMVEAMKRASGRDIPVEIKPRREGDLACVYAEPDKVRAAPTPALGDLLTLFFSPAMCAGAKGLGLARAAWPEGDV